MSSESGQAHDEVEVSQVLRGLDRHHSADLSSIDQPLDPGVEVEIAKVAKRFAVEGKPLIKKFFVTVLFKLFKLELFCGLRNSISQKLFSYKVKNDKRRTGKYYQKKYFFDVDIEESQNFPLVLLVHLYDRHDRA